MITGEDVLDVPMQPNDSGADTIRGYLIELLATLWRKGEGFSGKRPFGTSCWDLDLHEALVRAGLIRGHIGEWGLADVDQVAGDELITKAIGALGAKKEEA